nr:restriction endonuclease subunit S [Geothrix sp. SG200]
MWTRLTDVFLKITDGTHHSPPNGSSGNFLYVTAKNIKPSGVMLSGVTYVSKAIHDEIYSRCNPEPGDILYIKDGATTGVVTVNDLTEPFSLLSSVGLLKTPDGIVPWFACYAIRSGFFFEQLRDQMAGVGIPRVTLTKLESALLPLPPTGEQRRIVARVDELMALLDRLEAKRQDREAARTAARDSALAALREAPTPEDVETAWLRIQERFQELFATHEDVAPLRQAILQLAIRGRLLPEDESAEPAAVAFARLRNEWARKSKERKAGKPSPIVPVTETERAFALPRSWEWVRFGDLFDCRLGKMLDKSKNRGIPRPYLRNANVRWGWFDLTDLSMMRIEESELDDVSVVRGDLVLCEGGEPGRCAVWDSEDSIVIQKACHRARPMGGINSAFYMVHIQADAGSGRLSGAFTGATIRHLTGQSLSGFPVALPPVAEQERIVCKVNDLLGVLDRLSKGMKWELEQSSAFSEAAVHYLNF